MKKILAFVLIIISLHACIATKHNTDKNLVIIKNCDTCSKYIYVDTCLEQNGLVFLNDKSDSLSSVLDSIVIVSNKQLKENIYLRHTLDSIGLI